MRGSEIEMQLTAAYAASRRSSEMVNELNAKYQAELAAYRGIHAKEMDELQEQLLVARERNIELRNKLLAIMPEPEPTSGV